MYHKFWNCIHNVTGPAIFLFLAQLASLLKLLTATEHGNTVCFFRVSVPAISLAQPYKLRPHRRKSFDPSDSVSLASVILIATIIGNTNLIIV